MVDYLFLCSHNKLRSPTAEHVARTLGYKAISAGTDLDAIRRVNEDDALRADRIVCMQEKHAISIRRRFPNESARIEVWNIPDDYAYCDPELIRIVRKKLGAKPEGN